MKFLLQRVKNAAVSVEGNTVGRIKNGLLVLIGIGEEDTLENADWLIQKLSVLRLFEDENGKTNLSTLDVGGGLLLVSQFTLYADCKKGSRPGFSSAASPALAKELYTYIVAECKKRFPLVETGVFGAHMEISMVCDGPFTVMLER